MQGVFERTANERMTGQVVQQRVVDMALKLPPGTVIVCGRIAVEAAEVADVACAVDAWSSDALGVCGRRMEDIAEGTGAGFLAQAIAGDGRAAVGKKAHCRDSCGRDCTVAVAVAVAPEHSEDAADVAVLAGGADADCSVSVSQHRVACPAPEGMDVHSSPC